MSRPDLRLRSPLPRAPSWKCPSAEHCAGVGSWDDGTIIMPVPSSFQTLASKPGLGLSLQHLLARLLHSHAKQGASKRAGTSPQGTGKQHVLFLWLRYLGRSCVSVDTSSEPSAWLPAGNSSSPRALCQAAEGPGRQWLGAWTPEPGAVGVGASYATPSLSDCRHGT